MSYNFIPYLWFSGPTGYSTYMLSQHEFDTIKHHVNYELPPLKPGQEWRSYPELPTGQDLNPDWDDPQQMEEIRHLLPNTWQKPWKDKDTYLETHYRLQREEGITMLRYSIKKFKDDPTMMDDAETCIYTKVNEPQNVPSEHVINISVDSHVSIGLCQGLSDDPSWSNVPSPVFYGKVWKEDSLGSHTSSHRRNSRGHLNC